MIATYTATITPATRFVFWVERASGYVAGHAANAVEAADLADRCNRAHPTDPARVMSAPSLASWVRA